MKQIGNQTKIPNFSEVNLYKENYKKDIILDSAVEIVNGFNISPNGFVEVSIELYDIDKVQSNFLNIKCNTNEIRTSDTKYKSKRLEMQILGTDTNKESFESFISLLDENIDYVVDISDLDMKNKITFKINNRNSENRTISNIEIYRSYNETEDYMRNNENFISRIEIRNDMPSERDIIAGRIFYLIQK